MMDTNTIRNALASQSTIESFQRFLDAEWGRAGLDSAESSECWFEFWRSFRTKCEKKFPGLNGVSIKIGQLLDNAQFDLERAKAFARKMPNNVARLAFFIEAKADHDQYADRGAYPRLNTDFGRQCNIEIDKYEKLVRLADSLR